MTVGALGPVGPVSVDSDHTVIIGCIVFSVVCIVAAIVAVAKAWREIPDMPERSDD